MQMPLEKTQENSSALFETCIQEMDRIKQKGSRIETNLFFNVNELQELFTLRKSYLFIRDEALLLLVSQHDGLYYECYYYTCNIASLTEAFAHLKQDFKEDKKIRIIIVGKDEQTAPICEAFYSADCALHRKLLRRRSLGQTKEQNKKFKLLIVGEEKQNVCFAKKSDIDEIYSMLIEEFDYYGDNIPDKEFLHKQIKKKNIIVVRKDNCIAALHLFTLVNNIYSGIFDLTRKAYRLDMLQPHIHVHLEKYLKRKKIKPARSYEWRDVKKIKLIKSTKNQATFHETDVIYINFLLYPAMAD